MQAVMQERQTSEIAIEEANGSRVILFIRARKKTRGRPVERTASVGVKNRERGLLLPSTLLVAIQTQLLAPFVFIDFGLTALFQ